MRCKEAAVPQPYHRFTDRQHPPDYRQEEIRALKQAIRATENRLVLNMPDGGLSNLLRFLVTRTDWGERQVNFAYVDCDALDDCLDREKFFAEIARQFCEQGVGEELGEDLTGYERLKRLLTQAHGNRSHPLVITVNKTDRMLANADRAFYRKLKALADHNKRICYIFGGSLRVAHVVDVMEPLFAGRWLRVGRFNERDFAGAVIEEARRLDVTFDVTQQKQLARLTGGHPGLLRAVSSAVVEEKLDLLNPELSLVERLLARADVTSRCQQVWQALNTNQQGALQAIVEKQLNAVAQESVAWLRKFGLIGEQDGTYRLFSPIFASFVATQPPVEAATQKVSPQSVTPETSLEPIRIDKPSTVVADGREIVIAGKVFKGNQEVHVAPLELRLIACLKREPKVYTHSQLAEYVYYEDYKPGEGVPDDRIQNLVRQVRKRLGDHRYIKTYSRRGYEFIDQD